MLTPAGTPLDPAEFPLATARASLTFPSVRRVPIPIVILLCLLVAGGTWWYGTKDYDFLKSPTPEQLEFARVRAAGELAQPSDLFAVEPVIDPVVVEIEPPEPPPKPPPPIPSIELGDLTADPQLDAWNDESDKPAASFINLASKLEADTRMIWALLGWERVLDTASPSDEQRKIALNGVRRLRATLPLWNEDPEAATPINLIIDAPGDRLKLSMKAAHRAAEVIDQASSGIVKVTAVIREGKGTAASPKLKIMLTSENSKDSPSVVIPAPESSEEIEKTILSSVFKLVGSKLALSDDLNLLSPPEPGEPPAESIEYRITRLTWRKYVESMNAP
ncbi:MAG: hypothetical protein ABJO14_01725 [Haloferula sp.]|uniref:hypothetical protein n=1 Tax=Haloferula sp. TaxID=2497595 RepID=UPI00329C324A